jgi:quercetin dioxygenase-like cupin family protein
MPTPSRSIKSILLNLALANFALAAAAQVVSVTYAPPAHAAVLGSTFVSWDSLTPRSTPVGQQRAVFDNPTPTLEKLESHITTLMPGMASHPVHRHPWEEIMLLTEGDLDVSINGQKHHAGPGSLIFLASNDAHNLTNTGSKPATYYIVDFYTDRVHTVADKPAAEQAVPGMLQSSIIDCNSLPAVPAPTGSRVSVVHSPTLTFLSLDSHITILNAGQSTQASMIDSGDEVVILKSGQVEVTVNGVASRMNQGSMWYWVPNDKRTVRNIGTTPAVYQVIKVTSDKSPR